MVIIKLLKTNSLHHMSSHLLFHEYLSCFQHRIKFILQITEETVKLAFQLSITWKLRQRRIPHRFIHDTFGRALPSDNHSRSLQGIYLIVLETLKHATYRIQSFHSLVLLLRRLNRGSCVL